MRKHQLLLTWPIIHMVRVRVEYPSSVFIYFFSGSLIYNTLLRTVRRNEAQQIKLTQIISNI